MVLDTSNSGERIGKELFSVLNTEQQKALAQYVLEELECIDVLQDAGTSFTPKIGSESDLPEAQAGRLYFCLESRTVRVDGKEVLLTAKEFDIFALLIKNPSRVFTFDAITDEVWHEAADIYSRKAINNHICNLRKKLKVSPDTPDYIQNIHGIGYRFNSATGIFDSPGSP